MLDLKFESSAIGVDRFSVLRYEELKLPVFSVLLSIPPDVQKKICSVATLETYLSRTSGPAFHHGDRVWCSLVPSKNDGIFKAVGPEALSRWMRTVMHAFGVPEHFRGGSIRMAASIKAIEDGCDPRFVLRMGRWRSGHVLDAFYNCAGCRVVPQPTRQASQ